MEAAKEIARQLRLRNISGMIIIDFINMKSEASKDTLIEELKRIDGSMLIYWSMPHSEV